MAFQIMEIVDAQADDVWANVKHQDGQLAVTIRGGNNDNIVIGSRFDAELDYDKIVDWKAVDDFRDDQSGIWQEQDGIHLLGRIHNILDYGDGKTIIDVYLQNGPEFFTVNSDAIEDLTFDANTGLEIVVRNLYLYPVL
jgi:hypothetical protein